MTEPTRPDGRDAQPGGSDSTPLTAKPLLGSGSGIDLLLKSMQRDQQPIVDALSLQPDLARMYAQTMVDTSRLFADSAPQAAARNTERTADAVTETNTHLQALVASMMETLAVAQEAQQAAAEDRSAAAEDRKAAASLAAFSRRMTIVNTVLGTLTVALAFAALVVPYLR